MSVEKAHTLSPRMAGGARNRFFYCSVVNIEDMSQHDSCNTAFPTVRFRSGVGWTLIRKSAPLTFEQRLPWARVWREELGKIQEGSEVKMQT